ncbi:MAG TPA: xanthine dehydrogenase family protein molybdopterin-binding subunit [Candidatus Limnocylindria bacterium]|nr:xanthine dehydrogenase family protein molybdopterin-binding subunit [Candidatus Limnocylindria bacterium]
MYTTPIGRRAPVLDARDRVRGAVRYTQNVALPGMLHARILRSSVAHGELRQVDLAAALRVRGVVAAVSGADVVAAGLPGRYGQLVRDTPILAIDRVRYVGEPIAAVAAVDLDAAEEALDAIGVEIEPLPAVFDPADSLAPGAPLIHDAGNALEEMRLDVGDVDAAFAAADLVVTEEFHTPSIQGVPLEPHVAVADASGSSAAGGPIVVHTATQTPYVVRRELAAAFGVDEERVRVVVQTLGGGFGAKAYPRIEPIAVLLSQRTGRPVRIGLSRSEEFITVQRQSSRIRLSTAVAADGRILAMDADALFGSGAYTDNGPRVLRHGLYSLPGPYRLGAIRAVSRGAFTNLPPCGPMRAPGTAQAQWAREAHLESIAARLGMDPLELRRRNLVRPGDRFVLGGVIPDVHVPQLLAAVQGVRDVPELTRGSTRIGFGFGVSLKTTNTPSTSEADVQIGSDGRLAVMTSSVEMGQGARTALAQLAASVLGLEPGDVDVSLPDTQVTPRDQGTTSSRTTFSMGTAVQQAVEAIRDRLLALAAERLEIAIDDLVLERGTVAPRGAPALAIPLSDLVAATGEPIAEHAQFVNTAPPDPVTGKPGSSTHYHQSAAGARVAVDVETGAVRVEEVRAATHAGMVVNPTLAELQNEGNVAFGLGQALMEEALFDGGQMVNASLADYLIPSIEDFPTATGVALLEDEGPHREIHGIGETALPAVVPAITNAVADALGIRLDRIPVSAERLIAALQRTADG